MLSPFEVTGTDDVGYQATSTLAGTRLRTDLRDIGSSISIVNEEFLRDTGSQNLEDVLIFTPNTEIGGLGGNHSGSQGANPIPEQQRDDPSGGITRVRGLASADLTRDYFITNIPFDTFNTDRVDVQRGANSALYGLGSPGGIVNAATIRADFLGNRGRVRFETDNYGTLRYSMRYNQMIGDKAAIRIAGLSEDKGYEQKQAFLEDNRLFVAATVQLPFNLTARANAEIASRHSANPDYVPPNDGITPWINLGKPIANDPAMGAAIFRGTGTFVPGVANSNFMHISSGNGASVGLYRFYQDPSNPEATFGGHNYLVQTPADGNLPAANQRFTYPGAPAGQWMRIKPWDEVQIIRRSGHYSDGTPVAPGTAPFFSNGFVSWQITDRSIFDYRENLFNGGTAQQRVDWENYTASIEGTYLDNRLGFEFTYNEQTFESMGNNSLQGVQQRTIYIDPNAYMMATTDGTANGPLIPNPTFGRPIMGGGSGGNRIYNDRDSLRFQGFAELRFDDFMDENSWLTKALGKLTLTGLLDSSTHYNQTLYSARADPIDSFDIDTYLPGHHAVTQRSGQEFALPVSNDMNFLNINSISDLAGVRIQGVSHGRARTNMRNTPIAATFTGWNPTAGEFVTFDSVVNHLYQPNSWPAASHANKSINKVDSEVLIAQHSIWDNTIVLTGTWRSDKATQASGTGRSVANARQDIRDTLDPEYLAGPQGPYVVTADDETTSYSVMVHTPPFLRDRMPFGLSVYKSEADNFTPTGGNVTIFNDTVGATAGVTEEMGFIIEALDGKLSARFNWFESSVVNNRYEDGAVNATEGILLGLAREVNNPANSAFSAADVQQYLPPAGVIAVNGFQVDWNNPEAATTSRNSSDTGTQDFTAKGMEVEISYNPTSKWTILFTAGQQETIADNTYPEMQRYVEEFVIPQWVNSSFAQNYYIDAGATQTLAQRAQTALVEAVQRGALQDGNPSKEQAEWRWALNTSYNLGRAEDGILKWFGDLTVGGGVRWQDKTGIGFEVGVNELGDYALDITKPFWAPSTTHVDVFARMSYDLKDERSLDLQFNIKDLTNHDGLIPFVANPDGSLLYRIQEGRLISASATLNF
ncbi:TonB-dependent receptor plug domain-containing protein [Actomonas aquatica]|uniref:TonB-dependent receptor plug domain-containing protein n=1 Tax=Actomonas aquatica TaxID=2866162 RepID=A0ABZ1CDB9_9BACT|nr:TonB-dependent receptor plug domain-containing protein [Opitutus sp. WL0086]WRQ89586.1 TonB-dependent receptor plug domain-containing protein [Opitutus sp. WL0086]